MPAGSGYPNTDLLIYVTAVSTPACSDSGRTLAYASVCQRFHDDRTSIARINFCPNSLSLNASQYHKQLCK